MAHYRRTWDWPSKQIGKQSAARKRKSTSGRAVQLSDEGARKQLVAILTATQKPWRSPIQDEWPLTMTHEIWPAQGPRE